VVNCETPTVRSTVSGVVKVCVSVLSRRRPVERDAIDAVAPAAIATFAGSPAAGA